MQANKPRPLPGHQAAQPQHADTQEGPRRRGRGIEGQSPRHPPLARRRSQTNGSPPTGLFAEENAALPAKYALGVLYQHSTRTLPVLYQYSLSVRYQHSTSTLYQYSTSTLLVRYQYSTSTLYQYSTSTLPVLYQYSLPVLY
ncbi:unnamed protein product [Gadus morhua 'NCC']